MEDPRSGWAYVPDSEGGVSWVCPPLAGEAVGGDSWVIRACRSGGGFLGSREVGWTPGSISVGMGSRVPEGGVDLEGGLSEESDFRIPTRGGVWSLTGPDLVG